MKHKILTIFFLTVFLSLAMISAASLTIQNPVIPQSVNHDDGTFTITFNLVNTGLGSPITWNTVMTENSASLSFNKIFIGDGSVNPVTETITATGVFASKQNGKLKGIITATPDSGGSKSLTFEININNDPQLSVSSSTISASDTQTTLLITNNGNVDFSSVNIVISTLKGTTFDYPPVILNLNKGTTQNLVVDVDTTTLLSIGSNSATVTLTGKSTGNPDKSATGAITIEKNFCKAGEQGTDLEISKVEIDNSDGDDEEWSPLDEIEIKVEVENNGDEKIKDVFVEIGLINSEGRNVIKDMDNLDDDEIDLGSIKDDDEDTATFTFTIPADFESENYKLVVKAYSDDLGEDKLCTAHSSDLDNDFFHSIDGEREPDAENHIIFTNIKITPSPAQCNERVQLTGEVVNIGDDEYEDQVKVTLFNSELGLNLEKIIREDFNEGDEEVIDFEFDIPQNAVEKIHVLEFRTYYDYDKDDDTYDEVSEERFTSSLRVEGSCSGSPTTGNKDLQITADLDSETPVAVAGKQVIVNARLRNTGNIETTYSISVFGNSEWSTISSIDPQVSIIKPGESKDVSIVLNINEDASGDNEFTIRTSYNGSSKEQKVVLSVNPSGTQTGKQSPIVEHIRANWFIYLIILVNIILIIAIILVIRSMVAPSPAL